VQHVDSGVATFGGGGLNCAHLLMLCSLQQIRGVEFGFIQCVCVHVCHDCCADTVCASC